MPTLYSSIIRLYALQNGAMPQTQGNLAHAAFLDLVRQVAPELSQALHDRDTPQPFTLSQLNGLPEPQRGQVYLRQGWECWLRVTLVSQALFGVLVEWLLRGQARPVLRLGELTFGVSEALTTPGSHPWAGYVEAAELATAARDDKTIAFEFASPFGFSLGDNRVELMPRPDLLFGGLHKKWRQWCGLPLPGIGEGEWDYKWLCEYVLVSEWKMQSRMLRLGKRLQVGSVGSATFRIFGAEAGARRALNALADFAFYAGVGRKTAQGMGQTRRL
jgi:CRISPR-associated endoribonuclease Cas6